MDNKKVEVKDDEMELAYDLGKSHKVSSEELEDILRDNNSKLINLNNKIIDAYKIMNLQKDIIEKQQANIKNLEDYIKSYDSKINQAKIISLVSIVIALITIVILLAK